MARAKSCLLMNCGKSLRPCYVANPESASFTHAMQCKDLFVRFLSLIIFLFPHSPSLFPIPK